MVSVEAVRDVHDFNSLLALCRQELDWDFDSAAELEEMSFEWDADELRLSESSALRLRDGVVRQLQPFPDVKDQPWGIFFVEFADQKIYRTALRQILRTLVPKQRGAEAGRPTWKHENLLFICATKDYQHFTFAHFRGQIASRALLATFGWERGDTHIRTLCEFNLPALRFPANPDDREGWLDQWRKAFDVEAVTDKFFADYRKVFTDVEAEAQKTIKQDEARRFYTQRLFNRMMFIYFIQKKGWLSFEGDKNYLRTLFNKAEAMGENFLRDRLYYVFFSGLSNVLESREGHNIERLIERRGETPYLNGGLFDMEDEYDKKDAVKIPNSCFAEILALFEKYNFTVTESTPLDVQVAVDPEMLGKVFEELVTGRHESGSYYTPRQVVSFMCREALKYYLADSTTTPLEAIAPFVDDEDTSELRDAEATLEALKRARVCDPACGSGAYLLGMMQELLRLRSALFKSNRLDDESVYERKRSIIENNLYGVDKDRFAVQIACLRLWLSLAIDSQKPQPLPNLDFKIGCGDSLTAPSPTGKSEQLDLNRGYLVSEFRKLKSEYMRSDDYEHKKEIRKEIDEIEAEIALALKHKPQRPNQEKVAFVRQQIDDLSKQRRQLIDEKNHAKAASVTKQLEQLKRTLAGWESVKEEAEPGFDWAVKFAEIFSPETGSGGDAFLFANRSAEKEKSGFDIVLANPPYVRADAQFKHLKDEGARQKAIEQWKDFRERLLKSKLYKTLYEKWDLYIPFLERAWQLLKKDGDMVFIIPDAYNAAKYCAKSHGFFLENSCIRRIDFCTDIPLFKAGVANTILHFCKSMPDAQDQPLRELELNRTPRDNVNPTNISTR